MDELVVASYEQLQLGQVYRGVSDQLRHKHPNTVVLVVREATEAEYRQCLVQLGSPDDMPFWDPVWFYWVRMD